MKEKQTQNKKRSGISDADFDKVIASVTALLFFGIIISLALATAFSEKETFSETQNRKLAEFPKFSGKTVYNGKFTSGVEDYISDHFIGHDGWIAAMTAAEMFSGKRERNDIYILKDRLVEKIPEPDMTRVGKSIDGIMDFCADNNVTPYIMIVPTQAEIYRADLPDNAPNPDQQEFIKEVYSRLEGCAVPIDVYSSLSANKDSYIYYRTDHHWTTRGAFLAYTAAAKRMDMTPLAESDYDIEHASDSFRGTFYSKALYDGIEPDIIDLWLPCAEQPEPVLEITSVFGQEPEIHKGLYFREYLDVKDKYSTYFGINQPMITIKTGSRGGRLLMFKDSYAHSLAPFLTAHYSEITMVDLRYIQMSYKELIDVSKYDDVLFLYNASTFMSEENLKKLMY